MNRKRFVGILVLALMVLPWQAATHTTSAQISEYALTNVTIVPNLRAFDISWVDPGSSTYYLSDRSNASIDVFSTTDGSMVGQIGGFVGNTGHSDTSGPDGVLVTPDSHQLWAGDGNSTVKVFDANTGASLATVSTGGKMRADEMAYDAAGHLVVVANDADTPPYLSFISTDSFKVVGKVEFPDATAGLEQPGWDPVSGMIYQSVPETKANKGGEVDVIDPSSMTIVKHYALTNCNPTGLALGPNKQAILGCGGNPRNTQVIDLTNGKVVATITQVGGSDQVWYNPGDHHYYLAASGMTSDGTAKGRTNPVLGIVDADTNQWIENVPTALAAHSVAADPMTNQIFVPLTNIGIGIYQIPNFNP